jgi:hypothetical protein
MKMNIRIRDLLAPTKIRLKKTVLQGGAFKNSSTSVVWHLWTRIQNYKGTLGNLIKQKLLS